MAHFIVTFRFREDDTRQERYDSFIETIQSLVKYSAWDQTTSFLAFEASGTAKSVCLALYLGSKFNATKDIMVVIDLDNREKATQGEIEYEALLTGGLGF